LLAAATAALAPGVAHAARNADPELNRLDSHLQAVVADEARGRDLQQTERREGIDISRGERVLVQAIVRTSVREAVADLRRIGMDVDATSDAGSYEIVEGRLPADVLEAAGGLPSVRAVTAVPPPVTAAGTVSSQGDVAHRGPQARASGTSGGGVTVGVISDSINQVGGGVAGSQATGNLPPNVTVLSDQLGGTDEGRAMSEIIFDAAPGVDRIIFGSAFVGGVAGKAQTIDALVANGAKVIADDTAFLNEPYFQDGTVTRAIDRARAAGVSYFISAGNQRRQSYESTFRASPTGVGLRGGPLHDFDAGAGDDFLQTVVNVPANRQLRVALQWDEPYGQAVTDLDVFITTTTGTLLGAPGNSDNLVSRQPFELANFQNDGTPDTVAVAIERPAGSRDPFMKYIAYDDFGTFDIAQHATNSDAIVPDARARGATTVAAVPSDEPGLNDPEGFSSRGPGTRLFDTNGNRLATPETLGKPEIAGADKISTSVTPRFATFFGTSAAAPSVAGVATLLRSGRPSISADEVEGVLTQPSNSNDCTAPGRPDDDCGQGFVFADSSLTMATTPPAVTAATNPPAPNGANGFFTSDVGVSFAVSDPESPPTSSGCGPTTVNTDTAGTTITCTAQSLGGTTTVPVQIKRDASPPTAPSFNIAAGTIGQANTPDAATCTSTDPTSGVPANGCQVSGFSAAIGPHRLTGVARNNAGLTSSANLDYRVVRTPAVLSLSAARRVKLRSFLRSGIAFRFTAPADATRVVADLHANLPGSARAARNVRIGRLVRTVGTGQRRLRVRLTSRGKRLMRNRRRTSVRLTVTGTSPKATRAKARKTFIVQR
jgi:hypothetical protein